MRASRRGLVDLIVMIVMIVFLLGMTTLAFMTYDKARKERGYLAALREIPARQQAELDAVKARYSELSSYIGFKGDAAYSSPAQIEAMLQEGSRTIASYYSLALKPEGLSGTTPVDVKVLERDEQGNWVEKTVQVRTVRDTRLVTDPLHRKDAKPTLEEATGRQDQLINELVTTHIKQVAEQRKRERELRAKAAGDRERAAGEQYANTQASIESASEQVSKKEEELQEQAREIAEAQDAEQLAARSLDSEQVREARERAFEALRQTRDAQHEAARAKDALAIQSGKRQRDDTRDPDGRVFLVDERSGYVWIDIGQLSGVHLEQTFQVVRPDASRASEVQIGEIRVKELSKGNVARCRVDSLDDPKNFPRPGDLIKNPNFSARQYQKWALVGSFGSPYTTHTRQQLIEILRRTGFQVVERIDETVDAVILGGNWGQDPEWVKAKEFRLNIETYAEHEILHFLGLSSPNRR